MTQKEFSNKFLAHLNEQQREAVRAVDGAVLLLAVPGSGKTTVLVTRLGYMVHLCGIAPGSILTMTYTVAATREMQERFASMFGSEYAADMEFRTINGLSAKIIDYYSRNFGKRAPFTLLENSGEQAQIIAQIYQKLNEEYATENTIKDIRTGITYIKNMMLAADEIAALDVGVPHMTEIYEQYCIELKRRRLMDFDDQMAYALTILNTVPAVLDYFQERYRYLCVDESQDTSKIQHAIIHLLAQKYGNIFMVGDEDQSIYGFRAAYPDALISFTEDYANAKLLLIEQNYRSSDEIIAVSNRFVSRNRFRHEKTITPTRGSGLPVRVIDIADRSAQHKYLFAAAQSCETETAVLFRNNDSALPLIDMLERSETPYNCRQFDGGFFSHRIVSDITDIINFAYNPRDTESFMRVYYKFGLPFTRKSAVFACEQSRRTRRSILKEMLKFPELSGYAREGINGLLTLLPIITESGGEEAIKLIWDSVGYGEYVQSSNMDAGKYVTLRLLGKNEKSPRDLLRRLSELQGIIQNHTNTSSNKFTLSTIHSSKGLEYDRVFLLDIFDGTLPSKSSPDTTSKSELKQYEEDRRLYYVGMTRAKNELYLFNCDGEDSAFTDEVLSALPRAFGDENSVMAALNQNLRGKSYSHRSHGKGTVIAQCEGSVLVEYESGKVQILTFPQLFAERDLTAKQEPSPKPAKKKFSTNPAAKAATLSGAEERELISKAKTGCTVTHNKFGKGVVTRLDGRHISIHFDDIPGEKKFDLAFAVQNGNLAF